MTGKEFIIAMYCAACTYEDPAPMTEQDAAYNIAEYRVEGIAVPVTVTPRLYTLLWNQLYQHDMEAKA